MENDTENTADLVNKDAKTNDYERNIAAGAETALNGFTEAMFTEGGMLALMNRDGNRDPNPDQTS